MSRDAAPSLAAPIPGRVERGKRIVVVGSTGSGKTTLAHEIASRRGLLHLELDSLYWDANWTPAPVDLFRERAANALSGSARVVDGSYSKVRDVVWGRADTLIWLDYTLPVIMGRLARRTVYRVRTRAELWNGNRERFVEAFVSRESIFWWALKTYRRRRRDFSSTLNLPEYAHLRVIHLRCPRDAAITLQLIEGADSDR